MFMNVEPDRAHPSYWDARYVEGSTPWDQGVVAPEVLAFATAHPGAGRWALDIGCGTGVHSRELARRGYQVIGIDLARVALSRALAAAQAEGLAWRGVQASAADLLLLRQSFDVALDIGCFHGLSAPHHQLYAENLARRLAPGGFYLLYAVHPRAGDEPGPPGVSPAQIEAVFRPSLRLLWRQEGWQGERRADWWCWQKALDAADAQA